MADETLNQFRFAPGGTGVFGGGAPSQVTGGGNFAPGPSMPSPARNIPTPPSGSFGYDPNRQGLPGGGQSRFPGGVVNLPGGPGYGTEPPNYVPGSGLPGGNTGGGAGMPQWLSQIPVALQPYYLQQWRANPGMAAPPISGWQQTMAGAPPMGRSVSASRDFGNSR